MNITLMKQKALEAAQQDDRHLGAFEVASPNGKNLLVCSCQALVNFRFSMRQDRNPIQSEDHDWIWMGTITEDQAAGFLAGAGYTDYGAVP